MVESRQSPVAIALYEPDIPQNLGSIMRLSACFAMPLHVIEPCGFPLDDKRIRRAGMDYIDQVQWQRHNSWDSFRQDCQDHNRRLILLTTKADAPYDRFAFASNDVLLFGRESSGVPPAVHDSVDHRLTIPMTGGARSLNLAMSAAIVCGEVMRQQRSEPDG